jgi:magnesium transporter
MIVWRKTPMRGRAARLTAQYVVDSYYPLLDRISNLLNDYEERLMLSTRDDKQARRPVYRVKQQLIHLRQMIAPQREVLSNVIGEQRLAADSETRDLFRHLYERLMRVYDVIDSQRDLSSNVLDMIANQESRNLVEVVNRLTIFSMVFLPLTFFTNLFELGFATTIDQVVLPISGAVLFVIVMALMIGSAGFMFILFKRRRWL